MTIDLEPNLHLQPEKHRRALGPFPLAAPSDPAAPHVTAAKITVDAGAELGPLTPIWRSIGYDEINWTYTPTGKRLLRRFGEISGVSYHVRPHYMYCSGSGFGIPHWGQGNVYHEDGGGDPHYDFTILDQTYDAIVNAGHHVLVELGFTPRDLVPDEAKEFMVVASPTAYTAYEAGAWGYPPKDYGKWGGLIAATVRHCVERYGADEVSAWLWELWNEPDGSYWRGTVEQFNELYTVTARAIKDVLPTAQVGGPAVTSSGIHFLEGFLDYTSARQEPLDFISYHTKGSRFRHRTYGPIGAPAAEQQSPSATKMLYDLRGFNQLIAKYPEYQSLPAIVDECDAAVPAHFGRYDNANYQFQNTEYYPVFQVKLMKKILDLNRQQPITIEQATSWSFYFEGERYFEGTRSFLTAGEVEKPLLNAYRMLGRLGEQRISAASDAAWSIEALEHTDGSSMPEEIDSLAARSDDGTVAVLVWRHTDDQYQQAAEEAVATISVTGLELSAYRLSHFRIDRDHSNAHTVWESLGSPQDPSAEELAAVKARQGLEELEDVRTVEADAGALSVQVRLPLPAVSLLILSPHS